jgi:hypothetical protein
MQNVKAFESIHRAEEFQKVCEDYEKIEPPMNYPFLSDWESWQRLHPARDKQDDNYRIDEMVVIK